MIASRCGVVGTAPLDDRDGPSDERHDQGQSGAGEKDAQPPGRPAGIDDGDVSQVTSRLEEITSPRGMTSRPASTASSAASSRAPR